MFLHFQINPLKLDMSHILKITPHFVSEANLTHKNLWIFNPRGGLLEGKQDARHASHVMHPAFFLFICYLVG
jgi:hypothetical protein